MLFVLALIKLLLHLCTTSCDGYGYFRDEFYYIACSDRLAWGYVDHPALSILLLKINRLFMGDSLLALRFLPALAGAGLVYLTGWLVREMGGGKRAQWMAALAVLIAPVDLLLSTFYSMNAFEPLFWMGAALVLIRLINTGNARLWLLFGILLGLGFQNKHSMAFFGFGMGISLLFSQARKQFLNRWFWLGGVIALLIALPNLLWQATHNWATLEFMQNAQRWKNLPFSPGSFLGAQILFQHPLTVPLWVGGILAFLYHPALKKYRFFAVTFLAMLALFLITNGKPYYLSPIFPLYLGAGAILLEDLTKRRKKLWLSTAYSLLLVIGGAITLPASLPLLAPESFIRYSTALGMSVPRMERHGDVELPQVLADRFGWTEMTAAVAKVYQSLSPGEQKQACIYAQNYGEAGALEFFGKPLGLPKVLCGHNNYWLWGAQGCSGEVVIIVGGEAQDHREHYESVEQVATHTHPYAMPYEQDLPIFICRHLKVPLAEAWQSTKHYI